MSFENNRRFPRTRLRAEVKLKHPEVGEQTAHTRDISEGGAFVFGHNIQLPKVGDVIEVQVQGLVGEQAPVVQMVVARIDADGMALEFLNPPSSSSDDSA